MRIRLHFAKSKLEIKIARFKLLSYLRSLFNCVYFFLIHEILFENHILCEKVISIKIIVIIIIIIIVIIIFIIIIISLVYPLYSLLFGFYFQFGVLPVTRNVCYLSTCHKSTAWAPNARRASESDWPPNQQKLENGFEKV